MVGLFVMDGLYKRSRSPYFYALIRDPRHNEGYRRLSTGQTDRRAAREVAKRLQEETDRQIAQLGGLTWLEACEDFLARAPLKQSTKAGYVSLVSNVANSCLGDFNLRALTKRQIDDFVKERRRQKVNVHGKGGRIIKSTGRPVSEATIRRHLSFMSAVVGWTVQQGLEGAPDENILKTYDRSGLKESKLIDRHLRPVQFEEILQVLESEEDKRILITLVGTGLRMSEFLDLRWGEVDFANNVIEFGNIDPDRTKSGRSRRIPILPPVAKALTAQCAVSFKQKTGDTGYVFPSPVGGGRRYGLSSLKQRVRSKSRLKKFRIHDLRHTFASWSLQQGVDPFALALVLGHSDVSTTARYARHVSDSVLAQFSGVKIAE